MIRNSILAALPETEHAQLSANMELVSLRARQILYDVNQPIEHVYFPESGVGSIVGLSKEGTAVETATIGNEGMIGVPVFLQSRSTATQAFCQVPGEAFRVPGADFERVSRTGALHSIMLRYTHALLTFVSQCAVCNRLHLLEQRCARWLLMTHDRVGSDVFSLTQEFLSQMLGVRRATVSEAASALQAAGAIGYSRGTITVLQRQLLEQASCECYAVIQHEFRRIMTLGEPQPSDTQPIFPLLSENGFSTVKDGSPRATKQSP